MAMITSEKEKSDKEMNVIVLLLFVLACIYVARCVDPRRTFVDFCEGVKYRFGMAKRNCLYLKYIPSSTSASI